MAKFLCLFTAFWLFLSSIFLAIFPNLAYDFSNSIVLEGGFHALSLFSIPFLLIALYLLKLSSSIQAKA